MDMNKLLTRTLLFLLGTALASCAYTEDDYYLPSTTFGRLLSCSNLKFPEENCERRWGWYDSGYGRVEHIEEVDAQGERHGLHANFKDNVSISINCFEHGKNIYEKQVRNYLISDIRFPMSVPEYQEVVQACSYIRSNDYDRREEEKKIEVALPAYKTQCKAFGFTDDTPEMANCLLELYKIANQPQQNTVITNSAPARTNSSDTTSGIELMNRGLQILNEVGTPSAPRSRTSTCTRIGDISGQVVTFNNIACPAGYAPTF